MGLQNIIIMLLVGLVAGWAAGQIWKGKGFGLIGNLILGVVGAVVGSYLFNVLNISILGPMVTLLIAAVVGSLLLLWIVSMVKKSTWQLKEIILLFKYGQLL